MIALLAASVLAGALTIFSPCVLPVLPFVFARADRPFLRNGLPMLLGMASTFALVATLAAVGGGWAVQANQAGRGIALGLLALFGLALVFPALADRLARPLVTAGQKLGERADRPDGGVGASVLLGVATGLLWAPCAGPVLGLILTGAALEGASVRTSVLLLAYAAGAAVALGLALLAGGRVFRLMKRGLGTGVALRRGLGAAVLAGVAAIALGFDSGPLARLSAGETASLEQRVLDALGPMDKAAPVEGAAPALSGATEWLNSPPLTAESLRGKVVLVDFWTYSCINCLRTLPHLRAWAERYKDAGLVVIGIHAPEFAFERDPANVRRAVRDLNVTWPVALDNDYALWRAFDNQYWPAHYFIDATGRIRHHHFGEGEYARSERIIRQLLAEAGTTTLPPPVTMVDATGAAAPAARADERSPETYVGYGRAERFDPEGGLVPDRSRRYPPPLAAPALNRWSLAGDWTVEPERAALDAAGGRVIYRFHARDLHLVLGPGAEGRPVRFRVRLDDGAPAAGHGLDIDAEGNGIVDGQRLYQLIRQSGPVQDRTFSIEFLDPGVRVYAFTFG